MVVPIGDSPDTRFFIELSSHAADLAEARNAGKLALGAIEGSPLEVAKPALIGYAVIAFCRTILPSKVRRPLTKLVGMSGEMEATAKAIRMFRNRAVAHSQSDLSTTHAVALLEPGTARIRDVCAATVNVTLPDDLLEGLIDLIDALEARIDEVLAPVRQRLDAGLAAIDPECLIASATTLDVRHKSVAEFNALSTRRPYPRSQVLYWTSKS